MHLSLRLMIIYLEQGIDLHKSEKKLERTRSNVMQTSFYLIAIAIQKF